MHSQTSESTAACLGRRGRSVHRSPPATAWAEEWLGPPSAAQSLNQGCPHLQLSSPQRGRVRCQFWEEGARAAAGLCGSPSNQAGTRRRRQPLLTHTHCTAPSRGNEETFSPRKGGVPHLGDAGRGREKPEPSVQSHSH